MEVLSSDVTIVGGGVAGLWAAKKLIDEGVLVTIIEKSSTLADGATVRNEGWLHAGTYHAQAVENYDDAASVTERTIAGHDEIVRFAPESIDHTRSFAFSATDEVAHKSVSRWNDLGVKYSEINAIAIPDSEQIRLANIASAFEVKDKSVNSVRLCRKLADYALNHGARIVTDGNFLPIGSNEAKVRTPLTDYEVRSERFLLTAGTGIQKLVEGLTNEKMLIRYFQAHLLVMPRLVQDNYFFLDVGEAGIMNHGATSVVGINRDGIELAQPSYEVNKDKTILVHEAAKRLTRHAGRYALGSSQIMAVACCKPDIYRSKSDTQSLNVQIFEPTPNYVCAMPGKMTESPSLASRIVNYLLDGRPRQTVPLLTSLQNTPEVTPRPLDVFTHEQELNLPAAV